MGDASKCPGAAATQAALAAEVRRGGISLALHVGDLSYADGHYDRWNTWMEGIEPVSAKVPYMIAIGNHEYGKTVQHRDARGWCATCVRCAWLTVATC